MTFSPFLSILRMKDKYSLVVDNFVFNMFTSAECEKAVAIIESHWRHISANHLGWPHSGKEVKKCCELSSIKAANQNAAHLRHTACATVLRTKTLAFQLSTAVGNHTLIIIIIMTSSYLPLWTPLQIALSTAVLMELRHNRYNYQHRLQSHWQSAGFYTSIYKIAHAWVSYWITSQAVCALKLFSIRRTSSGWTRLSKW